MNRKHALFVQEYLIDLNASAAAIRAGYSERTSRTIGHELLTKPDIKAAIDEALEKRSQKTGISAELVVRELLRIATADVGQAFDDQGQMKPLSEIPEDVRRAISALEVNEIFSGQGDQKLAIGLARKVKFWDKARALELLGKHLRMFTEVHEHSGKDGKPIDIRNMTELTDSALDEKISAMMEKAKGSA